MPAREALSVGVETQGAMRRRCVRVCVCVCVCLSCRSAHAASSTPRTITALAIACWKARGEDRRTRAARTAPLHIPCRDASLHRLPSPPALRTSGFTQGTCCAPPRKKEVGGCVHQRLQRQRPASQRRALPPPPARRRVRRHPGREKEEGRGRAVRKDVVRRPESEKQATTQLRWHRRVVRAIRLAWSIVDSTGHGCDGGCACDCVCVWRRERGARALPREARRVRRPNSPPTKHTHTHTHTPSCTIPVAAYTCSFTMPPRSDPVPSQ